MKFLKKEREELAFVQKGFFLKQCHMSHFKWSKKGPPFSLGLTSYSATKEKKLDLFAC